MTDEEKYKVIFDWCVNYFNYAYSGLNYAYAEQEWRKESDENLTKYYRIYCRNNNSQCELLGLESRKKFLKDSKITLIFRIKPLFELKNNSTLRRM